MSCTGLTKQGTFTQAEDARLAVTAKVLTVYGLLKLYCTFQQFYYTSTLRCDKGNLRRNLREITEI